MSYILISSSWSISFQGSKGAVVIAGGDKYDFVALGSTFVLGVAGDVSFWIVMGAVLVGLLVELGPFATFSEVHIMQKNPL